MIKYSKNAFFSASLASLLLSTSCFAQIKGDCIVEILANRYSGNSFDTIRNISHEQLTILLEAARSSPSSFNEQPWYFIICDRILTPSAHAKVLDTLVPFNQKWAKNAPLLIIAVAASASQYSCKINRWGSYDTGAAALSMALQATSLGLMSHQIGGFDENKLKESFNIPQGFTPLSVIAIGYPTAGEIKKVKKRKALSENFFIGSWGQSYK